MIDDHCNPQQTQKYETDVAEKLTADANFL